MMFERIPKVSFGGLEGNAPVPEPNTPDIALVQQMPIERPLTAARAAVEAATRTKPTLLHNAKLPKGDSLFKQSPVLAAIHSPAVAHRVIQPDPQRGNRFN